MARVLRFIVVRAELAWEPKDRPMTPATLTRLDAKLTEAATALACAQAVYLAASRAMGREEHDVVEGLTESVVSDVTEAWDTDPPALSSITGDEQDDDANDDYTALGSAPFQAWRQGVLDRNNDAGSDTPVDYANDEELAAWYQKGYSLQDYRTEGEV